MGRWAEGEQEAKALYRVFNNNDNDNWTMMVAH
jgi:hypothetical protein